MSIILNIGLGPSRDRPEGTPRGEALDKLMRYFQAAYTELRYNAEATEEVLVVNVPWITPGRVYILCSAIGQDCIAMQYGESGQGLLVGPHARDWGAFDPSKFILPARRVF